MQKTTRIVAPLGIAFALVGTILAAVPANAATGAPGAAEASAVQEATGPQKTDYGVTVTTSIVQGDEIVVRGDVGQRAGVLRAVRGAAGNGYQTVAPIAADGTFELRMPSRGAYDTQDYGLQFGVNRGSTVSWKQDTFAWYAVRV